MKLVVMVLIYLRAPASLSPIPTTFRYLFAFCSADSPSEIGKKGSYKRE
jgi:hypothetical protein